MADYSIQQNADNDAAYQKALELAEEILLSGPVAVRMTKQSINRGVEVGISLKKARDETHLIMIYSN